MKSHPILLSALFCLASAAMAQEPTKAEIGAFLATKLSGEFVDSYTSQGGQQWEWRVSQKVAIDGCTVRMKVTAGLVRGGESSTAAPQVTQQGVFGARSLVMTSVATSPTDPKIANARRETAAAYKIRVPLAGPQPEFLNWEGKPASEVSFLAKDEELSARIKRALAALGDACGAKGEPF